MPLPGEHSCRLKDSRQFDRVRRDNSKNPNILLGFKGDKGEVISFRYPTSTWSAQAAKNHCSRHGGAFEPASGTQEALTHNSRLSETEPSWGDVDKTKLPKSAYADTEEFTHHWIKEGSGDKIYTDSQMYLHRGGFVTAWAAATSARDGQNASTAALSHLQRHRRDLGLTESQMDHAAAIFEVLNEYAGDEITLIENLVSIGTGEGDKPNLTISCPEEFEGYKEKIKEAIGVDVEESDEKGVCVFSLKLVPSVRFPTPHLTPGGQTSESIEVVDLQIPDHEPFLENVLESLEAPDGVVTCEQTLFQFPEGDIAEFIYQTHVTGIVREETRSGMYPTTPCHGKIRWRGDGNIIYGFTLPQSRLEEKDPLLTALMHEPIPVAYIRPPQASEWFEKDGIIESGSPGATKNRAACYITEDRGEISFGLQESGYHEFSFNGGRLQGTWALQLVPGERGMEWILSRISETKE